MAIEQTLSIVKPDAVAKNIIGEIFSRFEKRKYLQLCLGGSASLRVVVGDLEFSSNSVRVQLEFASKRRAPGANRAQALRPGDVS